MVEVIEKKVKRKSGVKNFDLSILKEASLEKENEERVFFLYE